VVSLVIIVDSASTALFFRVLQCNSEVCLQYGSLLPLDGELCWIFQLPIFLFVFVVFANRVLVCFGGNLVEPNGAETGRTVRRFFFFCTTLLRLFDGRTSALTHSIFELIDSFILFLMFIVTSSQVVDQDERNVKDKHISHARYLCRRVLFQSGHLRYDFFRHITFVAFIFMLYQSGG
jgi:hypothetical protein